MTKKFISQLVDASYSKDVLDEKKVDRIAKLLSRSELKQYVRGLKLAEKKKTITLVLPDKKFYNKTLLARGKKQIIVVEDPTLLLGAKVVDNDLVYDMSLQNTLEQFVENI